MSSKIKVLIADDEAIGRQLLEAILMPEGYDLLLASDGQEALDTALNEIPDFILLDVMMPKMDGFEVCKRIRQNDSTAHIPVFLITALDDRDSRIRGIDSGADDYISKPFDRIEIMAKIKNSTSRIQKQKTTPGTPAEPSPAAVLSQGEELQLTQALQELILNPEAPFLQIFQSEAKSVSQSRSSYASSNNMLFFLTNKLEVGSAAIANAILTTIWKEKSQENYSSIHELLLATIEMFNALIQQQRLDMLTKAGFSIGMLQWKPDTKELQACGVNQTLFVQAQDIMLGAGAPSSFQSYILQGNQSLSFPGTESAILLSPNTFNTLNQQDFLQFANAELIAATGSDFQTKLDTKFKPSKDIFGVKIVV